jgi:hypothetical protein
MYCLGKQLSFPVTITVLDPPRPFKTRNETTRSFEGEGSKGRCKGEISAPVRQVGMKRAKLEMEEMNSCYPLNFSFTLHSAL